MKLDEYFKKFYSYINKDICIDVFTECEWVNYPIKNNLLDVPFIDVEDYPEKYYVGKIFQNQNNLYCISEIKSKNVLVERLDVDISKQPLLSIYNKLTIQKNEIPGIDSTITTTYGKFIINTYLVILPFQGKLPYMNETPFNINKVKNQIIDLIIQKQITSEQVYTFFTNLDFLSSFCELFVPSITERCLSIDPKVYEKRKELLEKYKDKLDDPVVMVKLEDELINLDKKSLEDDESMGFLTEKSFNVHRKRMFLVAGMIEPFGDKENKYRFSTSNLDEGWKKEDLAMLFNEVRKGVYNRGINTAKGGYASKEITRMFQDTQIVAEDCETKEGISFKVTENNKNDIIYRNIIENGKTILITKDNVDKYVGKTVILRSPMKCKIKNNYCYKCCDHIWKVKNLKLLNTVPLAITSTIMMLSMKAMHGTKTSFFEITSLDDFLFECVD